MNIQEKYTRLLSLTEKILRLRKMKDGRGYLTWDDKKELHNAESMADRMIREHDSKQQEQKELF